MTVRLLLSLAVVTSALVTAACTPAHAQAPDIVAATEALSCNDGVLWHRSAEIAFCATSCIADSDCARGERCRVLNEAEKPSENGPLYADDMHAELSAAQVAAVEAAAEPLYDDEPACEGDCAPYTGDLEIHPPVPIALCDPFHDVAGAMLTDADEIDIASAGIAD